MTHDIIQLFHLRFENKKHLLSFLRDEFDIKLSSHVTYSKIIEEIIKLGKEEEFCQNIFGRNSFNESITSFEIIQGLQLFSKEELIQIANWLSHDQKKWTYNSNTIRTLIVDISSHVTKKEIVQCMEELIIEEKLPKVRQYKRWVIGPLGILSSIVARTPSKSSELIQILNKFINRNNCFYLKNIIEEIPSNITLNKNDPLLLPKFFQTLLVFIKDEKTLKSMNQLIKEGKLNIDGNLEYWDFIATPCGIFKRRYRGSERLAEILTHEFEDQELSLLLGKEGLIAATTKLRVLERCIKEKPSYILDEIFGLIDLWRIGKSIGLISPEKIKNKKKLIDIILIRLGFSLPPKLEGLASYEKVLNNARINFQDQYINQSKRNGIMIDIFARTESILKDLIYFHLSVMWHNKIKESFELNDKMNTANEIIRNNFVIEKNVNKMNLGPLINLLRQIKKLLKKDTHLKNQMKKILGRKEVLTKDEFKILDKTSPFRPFFEHDIKIEGIRKEVSLEECKKIINNLNNFANILREKQIYPDYIRITKEVTDEYGTTYVETLNEKNEPGIIKPKSWLRSKISYFMISKEKPIAIHPFLIEKFW